MSRDDELLFLACLGRINNFSFKNVEKETAFIPKTAVRGSKRLA